MTSIECQAEDYDGTRVFASGPTRQEALKKARKHLLESRKRSRMYAWLYHWREPQWPVYRYRYSVLGQHWNYPGEWRMDERRNM